MEDQRRTESVITSGLQKIPDFSVFPVKCRKDTLSVFKFYLRKEFFRWEFLNVMLKVWILNLFLQGLGMTLFYGSPHRPHQYRFGSLMALMRHAKRGHRKI